MIERVTIIGTGLIGASIGLALRENGFAGEIAGWDSSAAALDAAVQIGAVTTRLVSSPENLFSQDRAEGAPREPGGDLVLLGGPVLSILDWMERLAPVCSPGTLITDVGSTKLTITSAAGRLYNQPGRARFLPGHPMAGKEAGGAALAEAKLFHNAAWLFTPVQEAESPDPPNVSCNPLEDEWRAWVARFGARTLDLNAERHDEICAWVSHLPQMLSTALAALLEETFSHDAEARNQIDAIGGRALRETTRLGLSPYSMWRDVALTNTEPIAATLHGLEQRLAHLRENLRTPELREEFRLANEFRRRRG